MQLLILSNFQWYNHGLEYFSPLILVQGVLTALGPRSRMTNDGVRLPPNNGALLWNHMKWLSWLVISFSFKQYAPHLSLFPRTGFSPSVECLLNHKFINLWFTEVILVKCRLLKIMPDMNCIWSCSGELKKWSSRLK